MTIERLSLYSILLVGVLLNSCAIPVLPTGGPVDADPPSVVEASPSTESVNVDTDMVRIVFSEYIDQASLLQALSVTPEFDAPFEIRWRKTRVDITFPEPLRENTTYILTIDTNLRDANRVALKSPITIAFATGPTINRGQIKGRVADNTTGSGIATVDVYAYALPDSSSILNELPEKPDYRTQTADNGTFAFDYLSEQPYYVIALQDRNRNRRPDINEGFAVPPLSAVVADTVSPLIETPWLITSIDTIPPELQRVRALSEDRLLVRFSESIKLSSRAPDAWVIQDSTATQTLPVRDLFILPEDSRQLYLRTSPLSQAAYTLTPAPIADSSDNAVRPEPFYFQGVTTPDTLQLRWIGFAPESNRRGATGEIVLEPGQFPGVQFNQSSATDSLLRYIGVADTTNTAYPFTVSSEDGATYSIIPDATFPPGSLLTLTVNGALINQPDTSYSEAYSFLSTDGLGELSGVLALTDSTESVPIVELYRTDTAPSSSPAASTSPARDGTFKFANLPDKARYRLRIFLDNNLNNTWDGGQMTPYIPAEPVMWPSDSLQVRARWEQALQDTLRFSTP